jgi:hypothetical protein
LTAPIDPRISRPLSQFLSDIMAAPTNKLVDQVRASPIRGPSPQPTHLSVPGTSTPRMLQEEGPGYVAPKFEGKEQQMET